MVMNTVLNVKLDPELKRAAQEVAKAVGLPISTVVAAGLREFVRTRSITLSDAPRLKPEVEAELRKISADAKKGVDVSPDFKDIDSAIAWLNTAADEESKK